MPSLTPELLGFEIITQSDDNTFALGVNVARIGDTYVFIPTILKNGRIAPVDLMYIPEIDQFLPCKDAWITYLKSKKADLMATVNKKRKSGNAGNVDLDMPFTNITKVASQGLGALQDMAKETMVEALCSAPTSTGIPCVSELIDIAPVNGLKKLASYIESTDGHNSLVEFYSNEELRNITDKLQGRLNDAQKFNLVGSDGEVKILTSASVEARTLPNEDKVKILRDGAVIKDNRGLTSSKVYKTKTNSEWCTPNDTGVYELLKIDGSTMTAFVINAENASGGKKGIPGIKSYYVIPLDDGQARKAYHIHNKDIIGQPYADVKHISLKGKEMSSINSADWGDKLLLNDAGTAFLINIDALTNTPVIRKDDELLIVKKINACPCYEGHSKLPKIGTSARVTGLDGIVVGKKGSKIRIANNYLRVGSDTTYFDVIANYSNDIPKAIQLLASTDNILDAITRRSGNVAVDIFKVDNGVYIESDIVKVAHASKIDAMKALVDKLAVTPNDAETMVKEASAKLNTKFSYIVKIANDTQVALHAADLPDVEFENNTQSLQPMSTMSEEDNHILNKAMESGVKEIFDVSVLRILAEEDSPASIINEWMPTLFTALDKVGRILYLCRAGESMQDAYGVDRVEDVERKLRKQFNELGDIILTMLKGKIKDIDDLLNGEL
jgi:hypothetical protein